jgi:hypothetical protein
VHKFRIMIASFLAQFYLSRASAGLEQSIKTYAAAAVRAEEATKAAEAAATEATSAYYEKLRQADATLKEAQKASEATVAEMAKVARKSNFAAANILALVTPPEDRA